MAAPFDRMEAQVKAGIRLIGSYCAGTHTVEIGYSSCPLRWARVFGVYVHDAGGDQRNSVQQRLGLDGTSGGEGRWRLCLNGMEVGWVFAPCRCRSPSHR